MPRSAVEIALRSPSADGVATGVAVSATPAPVVDRAKRVAPSQRSPSAASTRPTSVAKASSSTPGVSSAPEAVSLAKPPSDLEVAQSGDAVPGVSAAAMAEGDPSEGAAEARVSAGIAASASLSLDPAAAVVDAVPLTGENPPPIYPRLALQRGWEGVVSLRVRVRANGEVEEVLIERSSGYAVLDRAALAAVKSWRFRAAQADRRAVAGEARVPVEFRLRGG